MDQARLSVDCWHHLRDYSHFLANSFLLGLPEVSDLQKVKDEIAPFMDRPWNPGAKGFEGY